MKFVSLDKNYQPTSGNGEVGSVILHMEKDLSWEPDNMANMALCLYETASVYERILLCQDFGVRFPKWEEVENKDLFLSECLKKFP